MEYMNEATALPQRQTKAAKRADPKEDNATGHREARTVQQDIEEHGEKGLDRPGKDQKPKQAVVSTENSS